jgi:hypothetical protein
MMKTETVKEVSMLVQLGAEYGLSQATMFSIVLFGAVAGAAIFATLAVKFRWV